MLARLAIQTSRPPLPTGRFEATYRLRPSGDWIGQPSSDGVLRSGLLVPIVSIFCADTYVAEASPVSTSAPATTRSAVDPREKRVMELPFRVPG